MAVDNEIRMETITLNGVRLCYFERRVQQTNKPTLLFVHATGFHGRVWDRVIESFPDHHVLAMEQRGHGRSEKVIIRHWREFGDDIAGFVEALGLSNVIGIGHSMGAHGLVDGAAKCKVFARLVLLDPVITGPDTFSDRQTVALEGLHPAARRRNHFASPEEMVKRLLPKSSFGLFEPRILDDYCRYGLLPAASGGYELACPPDVEASVYMTARTNGAIYQSVRSLEIPVMVMRARARTSEGTVPDFSSSPTWPGLADEFKHGREMHLEDCSHFIPMEVPDRVVEVVQAEIGAWSTA